MSHDDHEHTGDHEPPEDINIDRNRFARIWSVAGVALVTVAGPAIFGAVIGSIFGSGISLTLGIVGFGVGGYLLSRISNRLFVYNEEYSAYGTNDPISGHNVFYGPGLHLSHVWEERNKAGNYKLDVVTKTFEVAVQTTTANVTVTGSFQYRIDLKLINRFIGISQSTIENGLIAFIKSFLTEELASKDAESARASIKQINEKLKKKFVENEAEDVLSFEHQYGILTLNLILETMKVPDEVQKTRDAVDEATTLMRVVAQLSGMSVEEYTNKRTAGTITADQHKQLLDRAMAVSGNNAKITVNAIEGGSGVTPMLPVGG